MMDDEILIKFLLKETDSEENSKVQQWINSSEENANYFSQLEKIWTVSGSLMTNEAVNVDHAWKKFRAKTDEKIIKEETVVKPIRKNFSWLSIAAIIAAVIGGWTIYTLVKPAAYVSFASNDKVVNKILPDGTALTLNKNTNISYTANFKTNRKLKLKSGDVFFNVAHDQVHPFTVAIDQLNVEVVGTSFNIKHRTEATEIVVETGVVKVSLGNQQINLVKGERVLIASGEKTLIKEQSNDQLYNYYRTKQFVANNTPLFQLIAILNEAYGTHIIAEENVKNLTFTAPLEFGDVDKNLKIICEALKLKTTRYKGEIILSY